MSRRSKFALLCAALAVSGVASPAAGASTRQLTVMQDDLHVRGRTAETLDEFSALGVDIVKLNLYWDEVAPQGRRKPAGFDAADPAGYAWGSFDNAVRSILDHGMRPYLSVGGHAPDWATQGRGRRGTNRPDAKEFRLFAEAAGRHYPEVDIWSIWNEPNLYSWLSPQRRKGLEPVSPSLYRGLYLAGHRGLRASGHGSDTILLGELMPRGGTDRRKVPPLEFLREMACLNRNYRQYRGRAAKLRGCSRVGLIPTSGLAIHPYTLAAGPQAREARDDASIGQLGRVRATLDSLARRGKLPRRLGIWITEFGYQTRPPDPFGTALRRAPGLMDLSEWIAFRNRRVATYSQYTLRDNDAWQSGLRFESGRAKRGVYDAFRMPLLVRLLGGNRVEVFGGLRAAGSGSASIEVRVPGGRYRSVGRAPLNAAGYFRRVLRVRGAAEAKYRITIAGRAREKSPVAL